MDALIGLMYYSFSNYRLLPRNNDDIVGFSETLTPAGFICEPDTTNNNNNVNEFYHLNTPSIYPNPSNGQVAFNYPTDDVYQIDIFDLSGRHVFSRVSMNPIQNLDISFIESGVYMVTLRTQDQKVLKTEKIIIE